MGPYDAAHDAVASVVKAEADFRCKLSQKVCARGSVETLSLSIVEYGVELAAIFKLQRNGG
ncbi:MAG: hypothetical protein K2F96_04450 [Muribaculaceae bacterium]|nr:hypothetical protein [Muribaculaceae bacterium]